MNGFFKRLTVAICIALSFTLLLPLSVLACGGLFYSQSQLNQKAERIIFAVAPDNLTMYEQINYSGPANDFAWVLPVPSVPKVDTASPSLFQALDQATAPLYFLGSPPPCGVQFVHYSGAPAPTRGNGVNVYSGGMVGPYKYDVVGSDNPNALTQWLQSHNYHVPDTLQSLIQTYIQSHMLFLALQLRPQAGIQDIQPVKLSFTTGQSDSNVMIPLRMAAAASTEHMGLLVWIFGSSRYIPLNYQNFEIADEQLSSSPTLAANYNQLVDGGVSKRGGHAFVTEYARPTSDLGGSDPTLSDLRQNYGYVTRMFSRISPDQMTIDPTFSPQNGLPNVSNVHEIPSSATCDPFNSFLGQASNELGPVVLLVPCCLVLLVIFAVVGGFLLIRRRRQAA